MRLKLALAAVVAALGSILVAPAAAHAGTPDAWACSAPGSYSYLYGNTYALIGSVGNYRYWQVVNGQNHIQDSYVVRCNGSTIVATAPLVYAWDRCDPASANAQYQYVGARVAIVPSPTFPSSFNFTYWHVNRWVSWGYFGFWVYDHSEYFDCDI